jgi:hypothetical protein
MKNARASYVLGCLLFLSLPLCGAENLLKNPGFENSDETGVVEWAVAKDAETMGAVMVNKDRRKSGDASLVMSREKREGKLWCTSAAVAVKPGTVKLELFVRAEDASGGEVILMGHGGGKSQVQWQVVFGIDGTFDWQKFSETVELKEGVEKVQVSLRLARGGRIWFDDLSLTQEDASGENLLRNPGMEKPGANGLPENWHRRGWDGLETVGEARADTAAKSGKHAALIDWQAGGACFGVEPELSAQPAPGEDYLLSVFAKTSGKGEATLQVECYDKAEKLLLQRKSDAVANAKKWGELTLGFLVPEETAATRVYLLNTGEGKVWFDDAALAETAARVLVDFPLNVSCEPAEGNALWQEGHSVFNTFVDSPCSLSFHFWGKKNLKNPAFVIELAQEVELAECFNTHSGLLQVEIPEKISSRRGDMRTVRHIFRNPRVFGIVQASPAWSRELTMAFRPAKDDLAGKEFPAWFWLEDDGGKSRERGLAIKFLPPLANTPNPKNFRYYSWGDQDINFHDIGLLTAVARKYEEANMKSRKRHRGESPLLKAIDDMLERRGWWMFNTFADHLNRNFLPFTKDLAEVPMSMTAEGKEREGKVCPTWFLTDPEVAEKFPAYVAESLRRAGTRDGEMVCIDTEPWAPHEWCFCERCREKFARMFDLPAGVTTEDIRKNHRLQWREFRLRETVDVIGAMASAIRAYSPKLIVADYDYPFWFNRPGFENRFDSVAKDSRTYEQHVDAHFSSFYHYNKKEAFDLIDVNVKALKKDVYMTPSISRAGPIHGSYTSRSETVDPWFMRLKILGAAASGAKGISIYPGHQVDGLFFVEIDRAMAEIAVNEEFYLQGKRCDDSFKAEGLPLSKRTLEIEGKPVTSTHPQWEQHLGLRGHVFGGGFLLTAINFHDLYDCFVRVTPPELAGEVLVCDPTRKLVYTDPDGNLAWQAEKLRQGFMVKIAKRDAAFIRLGSPDEAAAEWTRVTQEEIARDYETACNAMPREEVAITPVERDGLGVALGDIDKSGEPEVILYSKTQKLWIDPGNGGKLVEWQHVPSGDRMCQTGIAGEKQQSLFWDQFWLPAAARNSGEESARYSVLRAELSGDKAELTLEKELALPLIKLRKTFSLTGDQDSFSVEYEITNRGEGEIEFSFWSHNFPKLGDPANLCGGMEIILPGEGAPISVLGAADGDGVFLLPGKEPLGFKSGKPCEAPRIGCYSLAGKFGAFFSLGNEVRQFYLWRGEQPTIEWMYDPVRLAPGEAWRASVKVLFLSGVERETFASAVQEAE